MCSVEQSCLQFKFVHRQALCYAEGTTERYTNYAVVPNGCRYKQGVTREGFML